MPRYCTLLLFILTLSASAQQAITVKYFGLTIHPVGDPMADLQPNKLDPDAHVVANTGIFLGYEKFVYEDLVSVKVIQGILGDCSNGLATVSHLGIRGALLKTEKHRVYLGIGPTLVVRDSWNRFGDRYESSGYFNDAYSERLGELQWKFIPYGFELEYDYVFTKKDQLSVSFTPAVPLAGLLSVGWKHWFNVKEYSDLKLYTPRK
jgi:hypothetical protein